MDVIGMILFIQGRNLGMAQFVGDVIIREVAVFRFVSTITIVIIERSHVHADTFDIAADCFRMGRPFLDDFGDLITCLKGCFSVKHTISGVGGWR